MPPERVRSLRGNESREAFARRLGVTAQTVYRWELPTDASESRRPRGTILEALERLATARASFPAGSTDATSARGATGAQPPPGVTATPIDLVVARDADEPSVVQWVDALMEGDFEHAPTRLLEATSQSRLSPSARALAAAGLAWFEVLVRSEARAAIAIIAPFSPGTVELSPRARASIAAARALAHALPDGGFLDPGRVHDAAQCIASQESSSASSLPAFLGWYASVVAALSVADQDLLERGLARIADWEGVALPAVAALALEEAQSLIELFRGQLGQAERRMRSLAERAEALRYGSLHARSLARLAMRALEDLEPPDRILAIARQARRVASTHRLGPGLHDSLAIRAQAEAHLREGRLDDAAQALSDLDLAERHARAPALLAGATRVRDHYFRGRVDLLTALAASWNAIEIPALRPLGGALAAYAAAMASLHGSADPERTIRLFEEAEASSQRWAFLAREVALYGIAARIVAGHEQEARSALRRVARFLDRAPSAWASAHHRRFEGMLLSSIGAWAQGSGLLDAARATFEAAGDRPDALMTELAHAMFAAAFGDASGIERRDAAQAELARMGIVTPSAFEIGLARVRAGLEAAPSGDGERRDVHALVVPVQRLTVGGATPELVLRELGQVLGELFPGKRFRLEEIDSNGAAHVVTGLAADGKVQASFELGDGAGRRFRLGVTSAPSREEHAWIAILVAVAGSALATAALRTLGVHADDARRAPTVESASLPSLVGSSAPMRALRAELPRLARGRSTVIVTGESGTGKEIVARGLHDLSPRASGPYVAFNCATIPRDLFESQLFGHKRGAFSGATADNPGVVRAADGGTLFLDEIGELPLEVQPKLLRFMENGEVFPVGATHPVRVDVRIVAATHRDLRKLVEEHLFREDLYYRLQILPVELPPLRDRRGDLPELVRHFLKQLADEPVFFTPDAFARLAAHDWPGNVRELRNVVERILAHSTGGASIDRDVVERALPGPQRSR
jgi:predicted ATP-dependent protease